MLFKRLKMKVLLTISFLILLIHSYASEIKVIRNYRIDSVVRDKSLKPTETGVSFTFEGEIQSDFRNVVYSFGTGNLNGIMDDQNHFDVKMAAGKYSFQLYYNEWVEEITIDSLLYKPRHKTYITVWWNRTENQIIVDKPVIYLYPNKPTIVDIQVEPAGELTFTYPAYNEGWKVQANPNGELKIGDKTYNYLFWESSQTLDWSYADLNSGFLIDGNKSLTFLEEKLTEFGLSDKEKADFITFWGPQLQGNSMNYIHFAINEDCNDFAELKISPKPDHIYRIYLLTFPVEDQKQLNLKEQEFQKIDRSGFTVIEWGGSHINTLQLPLNIKNFEE